VRPTQRPRLAWVRAPGAILLAVGVGVIVWGNLNGGWWKYSEDRVELAGLVIAALGFLVYLWARRATLQRLHIGDSELRMLTSQLPANVWATDTELRLTSVFGTLIARLENPAARVPGRTLYDIFETRDPSHPAIAAHLRALRGESATYERVAGEVILEGRVEPLRDDQGRVIGCVGTSMDVSTWRWAERQVRRYGALVQSSSDAIVSTDLDGTIESWNPAAERLYGYTEAEAIGKPIALIAPPGGESEVARNTVALRQGAAQGPYETQRIRRDGGVIHVSVTVSPIRDASGRVAGMSGIVRDITERKRIEMALRESEERFRVALRGSAIFVGTMDRELRYTWVYNTRHGFRSEDVLGKRPDELIEVDEVNGMMELLREVLSSGAGRRREVSGRTRGERWFYDQIVEPLRDERGEVIGLTLAAMDITERKRAEEEAARLASFPQMSPMSIVEVDAAGKISFMNPAAERLFPELRAVSPDHPFVAGAWTLIGEAQGEGEVFRTREIRVAQTWYAQDIHALPDHSRLRIYASDVTERKRAEDTLRRSEAMFRLLAENATDIISRHAPDGTLLYVSPACRKLLGYDAQELVGCSPLDFIHPDDAIAATPPSEALHQPTSYSVTFRFRRKDGTYAWLESLGHAEWDQRTGAVTEIHAASRDITDRMLVEEQLRRQGEELRALARHLESVREEEHTRMARDIHDELGQSLTALRLDLSWLGKKLPEAGAAVQRRIGAMVALTEGTIEAGRRIVAELRPPILDDLGVVPAVEWYVDHFAKRAGLRYELDLGSSALAADKDVAVIVYRIVQEALTNVARHAQAKHVTVRLGEQDGALTLEIHDDGRGICEDAIASPRSLGIVGMRERAGARGGSLTVARAPGGGTTVHLTFPVERRREQRENL
jgi:PAS domain S-box-containing protein